jgi:predicted PurR-regulated permease PerM
MNTKIDISIKTVLFAIVAVIAIWILLQIRDILFLIFVSFLLMTAIHPLVLFLEKFRIPRVLGILLVYAVVFGLFGASFVGAVPALITQSTKLLQELPAITARVAPYWNIDVATISQQVAPIGESLVKVSFGIFSNIISIVTVLVFTFYFLLERRHAEEILTSVIGDVAAKQVLTILRVIERRLGLWVRGELLLMSFVGILSFVGLTVLHVEFALPLAIIAGLLEVVPIIGPTVSAVPAVLVALSVSPLLALTVAALYIVIQQVENNFLVPIIMKKSVGFAPIMTILSLMIGGRLAGVMGAVLSVPVALVVQELLTQVLFIHAESEKKPTKNPSKS